MKKYGVSFLVIVLSFFGSISFASNQAFENTTDKNDVHLALCHSKFAASTPPFTAFVEAVVDSANVTAILQVDWDGDGVWDETQSEYADRFSMKHDFRENGDYKIKARFEIDNGSVYTLEGEILLTDPFETISPDQQIGGIPAKDHCSHDVPDYATAYNPHSSNFRYLMAGSYWLIFEPHEFKRFTIKPDCYANSTSYYYIVRTLLITDDPDDDGMFMLLSDYDHYAFAASGNYFTTISPYIVFRFQNDDDELHLSLYNVSDHDIYVLVEYLPWDQGLPVPHDGDFPDYPQVYNVTKIDNSTESGADKFAKYIMEKSGQNDFSFYIPKFGVETDLYIAAQLDDKLWFLKRNSDGSVVFEPEVTTFMDTNSMTSDTTVDVKIDKNQLKADAKVMAIYYLMTKEKDIYHVDWSKDPYILLYLVKDLQ